MKCFFCNEDISVNICQEPIILDGNIYPAHYLCGHEPNSFIRITFNDGSKLVLSEAEAKDNPDMEDEKSRETALLSMREYYQLKEFEV